MNRYNARETLKKIPFREWPQQIPCEYACGELVCKYCDGTGDKNRNVWWISTMKCRNCGGHNHLTICHKRERYIRMLLRKFQIDSSLYEDLDEDDLDEDDF